MAIGKITGSVVADNTLTESNLAFGVSGQSSASTWATDTLKVNIIESDDSTAIQINDSINVSGDITTAGTVEMDRLSLSSNQTTVPPLQLTANSLQDGVGALRIDGSQADIFLNPSTATHTTVTFAVNGDQRLAFGMDNASDFYITRRTGGSWYDDTFVIDRDTGELRYGYDVTVSGTVSINNVQLAEINNTQVDSAVEDIDTWSATTYRAAKYVYRIKNTSTSEYQSGEIMVLHDGSTAQIAEYSLLKTGNNDLITFSVDIDAGNVRLRGSAQATGSDIKLLRTLIED